MQGDEIICLNGEMGAGKTHFVKGFSAYFGIKEVSSPTYTIINEYKGTKDIFHFDVYRLSNEEDFYNIGGEEYYKKGICLIEWSENIKKALPSKRIDIDITKTDDNIREIDVSWKE